MDPSFHGCRLLSWEEILKRVIDSTARLLYIARRMCIRWLFLSYSFLSLLVMQSGNTYAQKAVEGPVSAKASSYDTEPIVVDSLQSIYRMQADGTGVQERSLSARIQSEAALKQVAVLSLPFASSSEHVEWVYARTRHKDGSSTETPSSGAMEVAEQATREAPFYSDLKISQLPLRDLRVGDELEWKARIVRTKAEAPGEFWGGHTFLGNGVVLSETLELNLPQGAVATVWSPGQKAVESEAGDRHVYRWVHTQLNPTIGSEAEARNEAKKKRVRTVDEELDVRQGKLPDVAWTTFKSWEAVGAWYRGLEGDRMLPNAEIKAKVALLTAGKVTEAEKVEAVYTYVATQIHYIGVAFGVGRYQPHSAADVLSNQYGDCKDKHTLLAAMLRVLGLHPDAVLIGAGIRFNAAVPSPASFNHLITRISLDGKPVWLDTTAEVAPFGMLIYVTRDRNALVVPGDAPARVERTPARPVVAQTQKMEAVGSLDAEGTSTSRITLLFRGDTEVLLRSAIRQLSPAHYDQLAQQMCASMGYVGTASHMDVSRVEDTSGPLRVSFDYRRDKSGDWPNLKILAQLAPIGLPIPDEKESPIESLELGLPRVETSAAAMTLPDGWTAELPEAQHVRSAWVNYDVTYRFEKGIVHAERRVEVLQERVPVADAMSYRKFAQKAEFGNEMFVQLNRKSTSGRSKNALSSRSASETVISSREKSKAAVHTEAGTSRNDASVTQLLQEAVTALKSRELVRARSLVNQVKAIDPTQPGLWALSAGVSLGMGETSNAIHDLQEEIKLHPSNLSVYPALDRTQLAGGYRADAKETLARWAEAAPEDPVPEVELVSMQLADNEPDLAEARAEQALLRTALDGHPNERLELLLGRAQLSANKKNEGHQTLTALLKKTEDVDLMNDTAYELANIGLELPLCEEKTRFALETMEVASRSWTLNEAPEVLRGKTVLLQASWDTMGWIYFREGDAKRAEPYVRAAWLGRQDLKLSKHLAEIDLSRGNRNAALLDYELGIATEAGYGALGVRKQQSREAKVSLERVQELQKAGAHSGVSDSSTALANVRKIPLGPGEPGVAEYKLLVSNQGIVHAEPTGDQQVSGAIEKLKRARMSAYLPEHVEAQLMFKGMVNCHSGVCELILEP